MSKSADAFRTISEVADWLGVPAHVLRFWESKFTQVKPVKRAGGRRYYRPADMQLLGGIRKLLHDDGMTIKGVQKVIRDQGVRHVAAMSPPLDADLEEAVAEIALDVPETEAPRGRVLHFDRHGTQAKPTAEAEKPAPPASADAEPDLEPAPEVENAAETIRMPDAAPEGPADDPAPPDASSADPAPPSAPPPEASDRDASPLGAENPERTPAEASAPQVAAVTVPDDPADDIDAPPSPLGRLRALDRATLGAQQPQLADLARRMSDLRDRMQGADTPS